MPPPPPPACRRCLQPARAVCPLQALPILDTAAMLPAVEISGLPGTATYEELRAVCGCSSVVFSLPQPGAPPRCLALFSSADGAAAARELLDGSQWGAATLSVAPVDNAVAWVAGEVPGVSAAALPLLRWGARVCPLLLD